MRLAIFTSHPIQYKSPLFRRLAVQPEIDLQVFYYSKTGLKERIDPYHGTIHAWDTPLLEGFRAQFLPNWIPESSTIANSLRRYIGPYFNPACIRQVLSGGFDAIILHSYQYPSDWLAWFAARICQTPILFYGEMYPRDQHARLQEIARRLFHRPMIRSAHACLAIGSVARDVFLHEYHVPADQIFLAPYAVDNDFFISETHYWKLEKTRLKIELDIPPELPVVLCVAGMVPKKRQEDLIYAMSQLIPPACLVLVGDGPLMGQIRDYCWTWLPETVLAGFINQSKLPLYYAIADVFVLPSLRERFGLVVNEAMCAGLPVIVTNTTAAARDLVIEGQNGYTFNPGDIEMLTGYLKHLLVNPTLRQKMGSRSQEIIAGWSLEQTTIGIRAALDFVIQRK